jgi:hypothetical protein
VTIRSEQIAIRLDTEQLRELDELARGLAEVNGGIQMPLAAVARAALMRGIADMRAELQPARSRATKPKRKQLRHTRDCT